MSAYMVEKYHVCYLVAAAVSRRLSDHDGGSINWSTTNGGHASLRCMDTDGMVKAAQMLLDENEKSIVARYHESDGETETITRADFVTPWPEFDLAQVAQSCTCYEYQACEHDGWETSEAHSFINALRRKVLDHLPGSDEAVWGP